MAKVTAIVPDPVINITLSLEEAQGLNTLLKSGTWCGLDRLLKIEELQERLDAALAETGNDTVIGWFNDKVLDVSDLDLA